jgi:hypothetical protein
MMRRAIVVRGRLKGPRLIELEEPVHGVEAEVEVVLREFALPAVEDDGESLIAVMRRKDVDAAIEGDVGGMEVVYRAPSAAGEASEEVTESPLVLVRRVPSSPKIETAPESDPPAS